MNILSQNRLPASINVTQPNLLCTMFPTETPTPRFIRTTLHIATPQNSSMLNTKSIPLSLIRTILHRTKRHLGTVLWTYSTLNGSVGAGGYLANFDIVSVIGAGGSGVRTRGVFAAGAAVEGCLFFSVGTGVDCWVVFVWRGIVGRLGGGFTFLGWLDAVGCRGVFCHFHIDECGDSFIVFKRGFLGGSRFGISWGAWLTCDFIWCLHWLNC